MARTRTSARLAKGHGAAKATTKREPIVIESDSTHDVEDDDDDDDEDNEGGGGMSAYEKQRLANIARNQEIMATIGFENLTEKKRRLKKEAADALAVRTAAKRRRQEELATLPRRQSRRFQGKDAEYSLRMNANKQFYAYKEDGSGGDVETAVNDDDDDDDEDKEDEEEAASWADTAGAEMLGAFCDGATETTVRPSSAPYTLDARDIQKVVAYRVYSIALHPAASTSILAGVGDTEGHVALWTPPVHRTDSDTTNGLVALRPHRQAVSALKFADTALFSSSFDGKLLRYDLAKNAAMPVFQVDTGITNFDMRDDRTLVSCDDGSLYVVDVRDAATTSSKKHILHDKKINTVHRHPIHSHVFATASLDRTVKLWDARKLKAALVSLPHDKSVNGASFSPDGSSLVSVCQDNYVYLFRIDPTTGNLVKPAPQKIKHDNFSGRWLTKFQASWDPKKTTDCEFVLGGNKRPRCIEIFGTTSPKPRQTLVDDRFASVHSLNVFHPTANVILGGNSSGRVALWRQAE
ncbi:Aste57867_13541 [Aphanomyces stellatus]|uniref:Aste57867_13541 protein n=1 Tax=Aphanomyces stellatus TaxID=120398 RepID=A0A485KYN3_9STRA|nr:hypothetical protein As57867_013491 [Aphanomyces stellatus]VFT90379.1 Aste57867_13541 [Aphanomyces stellatus]